MIINYFTSFVKANKIKILLLLVSIALYFSAVFMIITISRSLPRIAKLPLETVGAQVLVQHQGVIPDKMGGIVFPHANGPIYDRQFRRISHLKFVKSADGGIYFWDFTGEYKSVFGFNQRGPITNDLLKRNVARGKLPLKAGQALVSYDYYKSKGLKLGRTISIHGQEFKTAAVLKPNVEARVMPADIYIDLGAARDKFALAPELRRNYKLNTKRYVNVIALKTDPSYQGNKDKQIKALDSHLLIYSERTFSRQIEANLRLLSATGNIILLLLGVLIVVAFGGLVFYMVKGREGEIAILRALGWRTSQVRGQFIKELAIIVGLGLLLGNLIDIALIGVIRRQKVTMEIPWEISAKPHFLQKANAINRSVKAPIPMVVDYRLNAALLLIFILTFLIIAWLVLGKIKRVKALDAMLR